LSAVTTTVLFWISQLVFWLDFAIEAPVFFIESDNYIYWNIVSDNELERPIYVLESPEWVYKANITRERFEEDMENKTRQKISDQYDVFILNEDKSSWYGIRYEEIQEDDYIIGDPFTWMNISSSPYWIWDLKHFWYFGKFPEYINAIWIKKDNVHKFMYHDKNSIIHFIGSSTPGKRKVFVIKKGEIHKILFWEEEFSTKTYKLDTSKYFSKSSWCYTWNCFWKDHIMIRWDITTWAAIHQQSFLSLDEYLYSMWENNTYGFLDSLFRYERWEDWYQRLIWSYRISSQYDLCGDVCIREGNTEEENLSIVLDSSKFIQIDDWRVFISMQWMKTAIYSKSMIDEVLNDIQEEDRYIPTKRDLDLLQKLSNILHNLSLLIKRFIW